MKKQMNNYYAPTPKKWRKLGDAILAVSLLANGTILGMPMPDLTKVYAISICSFIGGVGKIITNFAKED